MMKHIVFLVGSYYPNYSAVGKCMGNIADVFSSNPDEYRVTIIAWHTEYNEADTCEINGQRVYRIATPLYRKRLFFQDAMRRSRGIKNKLFHLGFLLCQCCNALGHYLRRTGVDSAWVRAYEAILQTIQEPIDALIPTCSPFESIIVALNFRSQKNISLYPVLYDQFAENDTLHRSQVNKKLKMKGNLLLEQSVLDESTFVYAMPTWKNHLKLYFTNYMNHIMFVEHPLLVDNVNSGRYNDLDVTSVIYTGAVDAKIRPLSGITKILERYLKNHNKAIRFQFYVFGNDCNCIDSLQQRYPNSVANKGKVPEAEAKKAISGADILFSFGNTDSNQFPSKIFDYLSCGLPIVHFYINEDDPVIQTLNRYPLGLCLPQNSDIQDVVDTLFSFIDCHKGKRLSFSEMKELYPEASPEIIANSIEKHINVEV